MTRRMRFGTVLAALCTAGAIASAAPAELEERHERALEAYQAGNFDAAWQVWKNLAEEGFAQAQYYIAVMYRDGAGVVQDYDDAVNWYLRAAENGSLEALHDLSVMYRSGVGVEADAGKAISFLRKAAAAGYAPSQYNLGVMYMQGTGVDADPVTGYVWIYRAAEQGLEEALYSQARVARQLSLEQLREARRRVETGTGADNRP